MNKLWMTTLSLAASASLLMGEGFDLGKISVSDDSAEAELFEVSIGEEEIELHNRENIAEALNAVSGVYMSRLGGRSETTLSIRGFDSRRVGVFVDGVPIYVPYDGNIDYSRFTTSGIASIEVSKGYSSIVYGANTLAGVVNVVTKKPTKELEGKVSLGLVYDDEMSLAKKSMAADLGTRQGNVYAQVSASKSVRDHFLLSGDFDATPSQPEGERLQSASEDQKVSAKVGYLFEDGSEVALGYANQEAEKEQPPVTDTTFSKVKYWDWPKWDKESVYLIGEKKLSDGYIKGSLYHDFYNNALNSYDDATYTVQTKPFAFISEYKDTTQGGRLEYGRMGESNLFKIAANFKYDVHNAYDTNKVSLVKSKVEDYRDQTLSIGLEDTYSLDEKTRIMVGLGYDVLSADKLWDTNTDINLTTPDDQTALSPEAALVYQLDEANDLRASVARKTHLPTMKERYSRRLGTAIPNENLDAEQATHYEVAHRYKNNRLVVSTALYMTTIYDAIQSVVVDAVNDISQNQNVGDFRHRGAELDVTWYGDALQAGGSYAYNESEDMDNSGEKMLGIPRNTLFAYGKYEVAQGISLYANVDYREGAYSKDATGTTYIAVPSFTVYGMKLGYETEYGFAELGIKNLTDEDYVYDMGFPEPGREYFANLTYRF